MNYRTIFSLLMPMAGVACVGVADDVATNTGALEALPPRVATIAKELEAGMFRCPDRVWPGIASTYGGAQVLLTSPTTNQAYLVNDRSTGLPFGGTTPFSAKGLGPEWFATYEVGTYQGTPTVGISLDKTQAIIDSLAASGRPWWGDFGSTLAFHEGFHGLAQTAWPMIPGSTRFAPYPEPWQPRYLQQRLGGELLQAVRAGDAAARLDGAAHWRGRLLRDWPDDATRWRNTSVREGSAEYAEVVMTALSQLGCDASEADLRSAIVEHLGQWIRLSNADGSTEAYELGALSGLLLRARGGQGWEAKIASGTAPVDVLLEGQTAAEQPDDPAAEAAVRAKVDERNAKTGAEVEPLLERLASADTVRIPIPMWWMAGSFSTEGFVSLANEPGQPNVLLQVGALFRSPSAETVEVTSHTALMGESPCDTGHFLIATAPASAIVEREGKVSAATPNLTMQNLPATKKVVDGKTWICPAGTTMPTPPTRRTTSGANADEDLAIRGEAASEDRKR